MSWFYISIATHERFIGGVIIEAEDEGAQTMGPRLSMTALEIANPAIKPGEEGSTLVHKMADGYLPPSREYVGRLLTKAESQLATNRAN